jgi:hypothetical protein
MAASHGSVVDTTSRHQHQVLVVVRSIHLLAVVRSDTFVSGGGRRTSAVAAFTDSPQHGVECSKIMVSGRAAWKKHTTVVL